MNHLSTVIPETSSGQALDIFQDRKPGIPKRVRNDREKYA